MLQVLKHSSVSSSVSGSPACHMAGAGSKVKSAFLRDQTGTVSLRDKARDQRNEGVVAARECAVAQHKHC